MDSFGRMINTRHMITFVDTFRFEVILAFYVHLPPLPISTKCSSDGSNSERSRLFIECMEEAPTQKFGTTANLLRSVP